LTGNFHVNLEIVLRDLGVLDEVEFEITPKYPLSFGSECRRVTFRPKSGIPATRFAAIVRAINDRIGFVARPCVWAGLFHWIDRQPRGALTCCGGPLYRAYEIGRRSASNLYGLLSILIG
jgi:hypothetical protein